MPCPGRWRLPLLALVLPLSQVPAALAQPGAPVAAAAGGLPSCPPGNLLAGRAPRQWVAVRGPVSRATDGVALTEGAAWNASQAIVLAESRSALTWDLGAAYPLSVIWVQADNNDYYTLWGSTDGRDFQDLARVNAVDRVGLRGRRVPLDRRPVRYLRFGEGQGDRAYSLAEIEAYCQPPATLPAARLEKASVPAAVRGLYHYWNNTSSARWQLVLALLGLGLLQWGVVLHRRGQGQAFRRLRGRLLAALGLLSALTYVNFGAFHFGGFTHDHEWTHYYLGAKFFPELGHERLYDCLAVADDEDGLRRRVELRKVTNLRTNELEWSGPILKDPVGRCRGFFSAERWRLFKHDVKFFRDRQSPQRWDDLQFDHGFNGTPVWNIAGRLLTGDAPVTATRINLLALLDPLYLLATIAVIWWAFGWRVLAVGLLVFATNFPSRFYWTGGSFLRWDWLFYLVASICCLRKGRPLLGGLALGYATLLRVFPVFVFAGPVLAAAFHLYRHRRLDRSHARFFVGAALAVAVLVPASLPLVGGVRGYQQFVTNTIKHKQTPLTNLMGLPTVVAWRPTEVGRVLNDEAAVDPWGRWRRARLAALKQAQPLYLLLVAGFLVLLARAVRGAELWLAGALGVTIIAVGVDLLSYYYAFVLALALACQAREVVGRQLLLLTAFTQFVAWAPLPRMATWLDEQYTLMSLASVAVFAAILWRFAATHPGDIDGAGLVGAADRTHISDDGPGVGRTGGTDVDLRRHAVRTGDAAGAGRAGRSKGRRTGQG